LDILRRSEVDVTIAGLGGEMVTGAHGLSVKADVVFEDYKDVPDAVVFPGGMPGAENLASSTKVKELLEKMGSEDRIIAAICASPALVLAPMGILKGRAATCYPGLEKNFSTDIKTKKDKVVQDGNVITSRGPATAFAFGIKIAENLVGEAKARMVAEQMLYEG
jgi:4-methyl-5(b-hydroxyethyl)-thiazole monophosphate biosynthesis